MLARYGQAFKLGACSKHLPRSSTLSHRRNFLSLSLGPLSPPQFLLMPGGPEPVASRDHLPLLEVSRFSHPTLWSCSQSIPQPQPLIKSTLLSEPVQTLPTLCRRAGQGCPKKAGWEGSPRNHRPSMASQVCVPNKALHVKLPNMHEHKSLAWEAPHSPTAQSPKPETPRPREALSCTS